MSTLVAGCWAADVDGHSVLLVGFVEDGYELESCAEVCEVVAHPQTLRHTPALSTGTPG